MAKDDLKDQTSDVAGTAQEIPPIERDRIEPGSRIEVWWDAERMQGSGQRPQWFKGTVASSGAAKDSRYRIRYDDQTTEWEYLEPTSLHSNNLEQQGHRWQIIQRVSQHAVAPNRQLRSLQDTLHSGQKDNAGSTVGSKRERSVSVAAVGPNGLCLQQNTARLASRRRRTNGKAASGTSNSQRGDQLVKSKKQVVGQEQKYTHYSCCLCGHLVSRWWQVGRQDRLLHLQGGRRRLDAPMLRLHQLVPHSVSKPLLICFYSRSYSWPAQVCGLHPAEKPAREISMR